MWKQWAEIQTEVDFGKTTPALYSIRITALWNAWNLCQCELMVKSLSRHSDASSVLKKVYLKKGRRYNNKKLDILLAQHTLETLPGPSQKILLKELNSDETLDDGFSKLKLQLKCPG